MTTEYLQTVEVADGYQQHAGVTSRASLYLVRDSDGLVIAVHSRGWFYYYRAGTWQNLIEKTSDR